MNSVSLLQHTLDRYGVVTVMDARFLSLDATTKNDVLLELDTLKISNITADGSNKEVRGGMLADLLLSYNYGRTVNVEITDALVSQHSLKQMWGGTLNEDNIDFHNKITVTIPAGVEVDDTPKIIFATTTASIDGVDVDLKASKFHPYKPATTNEGYLNIYNKTTNEKLALTTDYTITADTATGYTDRIADITFVAAAVAAGDEIVIYVLDQAIKSESAGTYLPIEVIMKSTSFPPVVKLVGQTKVLDAATGQPVLMEIEIPRFQMGNSFDFNMEAEGDAAVFNFAGVALTESATKDIIRMKTLMFSSM